MYLKISSSTISSSRTWGQSPDEAFTCRVSFSKDQFPCLRNGKCSTKGHPVTENNDLMSKLRETEVLLGRSPYKAMDVDCNAVTCLMWT